jgi:H+/Cl- antiporter ClcA
MYGLDTVGESTGCIFNRRPVRYRVHILHYLFGISSDLYPLVKGSNTLQVVFALCACLLVRRFAIYARHSGIPEIKTVLGGTVIRHFMGPWTLTIKSLGLVCFHL